MNYTFTWGPETQDIVDGILTMEVSVWIENRTNPPPWDNTTTTLFYIVIKINDDDFGSNDYLGLVLDKNRNGVIDFGYGDHPQILYANNSTLLYSASLDPLGSLVPPEVPRVYMITCTYNPQEGYTFKSFGEPTHGPAYRLLEFTSTVGESSYLPIYLCFLDANSRFRFNLVSIEFRVYLD